jgi:hypothetical protein
MVLTQLLTVPCTCTLDNGQPVHRYIPISRRYEVLKEANIFCCRLVWSTPFSLQRHALYTSICCTEIGKTAREVRNVL